MAVAPSSAAFLVRFPEFTGAPTALVDAVLADAAARIRSKVFNSAALVEQAVMLQAAVLLLLHPDARQMRLDIAIKDWLPVWQLQLDQMKQAATIHLRVF